MTIVVFYLNCFAFQKFISNIIKIFCMLFTSFYGALLFLLYSFVKILLSFLDPRRYPEGSNKIGSSRLSVLPSILPSFRLSGRFVRIVSLIFSKFWRGARIPCEVVRERARFSRKIFFASKIGKMHPKWAKNMFF